MKHLRRRFMIAALGASLIGMLPSLAWSLATDWANPSWPFESTANTQLATPLHWILWPVYLECDYSTLFEVSIRVIGAILYWGPTIFLSAYAASHFLRCWAVKPVQAAMLHNKGVTALMQAGWLRMTVTVLSACATLFVVYKLIVLMSHAGASPQLAIDFFPIEWHRRCSKFPLLTVQLGQFQIPWFAWFATSSAASWVYTMIHWVAMRKDLRGVICSMCSYPILGLIERRCPECGAVQVQGANKGGEQTKGRANKGDAAEWH